MPLVRIELTDNYSDDIAREVADAIHSAIVEIYGIPVRDRFQILNRLPKGSIIAEDAGLGFERTSGAMVIQIFTQRGRAAQVKQRLYNKIVGNLVLIGVAPEDVFIGYNENGPEDWSFGFGRAQYLTGELQVPSV
jgi:hypothetical protein